MFDSFYPFLISSISLLHSLTALKTVANLVLLSDAICDVFLSHGLLDALHDFLIALPSLQPAFDGATAFSYWVVVFILGNLAASGEAAVESVMNHVICREVNETVADGEKGRWIRKEFVYFMSYLVESANETQVFDWMIGET